MAEEPNKKHSLSFWSFWGTSFLEGAKKSWEGLGRGIEVASVVLGFGLFGVVWYSKHHTNFNLSSGEEFVNYWVAVFPIGIGLAWFLFHVFRQPYEIYKKLDEENARLIEKQTPKFKLECNNNISACVVPNHDLTWIYLRMLVTTDCNEGIEGCLGHLTKIEKGGKIIFDHESRELPFAPSEDADAISKTLLHGVLNHLDILAIHVSERIIYFASKGRPIVAYNKKGEYVFVEHGEYILTVSVSGKGVNTVESKLKLNWQRIPEIAFLEEITNKSDTKIVDKSQ